MLSIGAALMGASHVVGVDIDSEALHQAQENIVDLELDDQIELIHADALALPDRLFTSYQRQGWVPRPFGIHVIAIRQAKIMIKSMLGGKEFGQMTKMPFANASSCIPCRFHHFRNSGFCRINTDFSLRKQNTRDGYSLIVATRH
jgi:23S rRNA G2445 N2-methylase RlmL